MAKRTSKKRAREETEEFTVAHVGEEMSFAHLAAKRFFETGASSLSLQYSAKQKVRDVFNAVKSGENAYGVVRIESTSAGTIHVVYDMLLKHNSFVSIVGEIGGTEPICVFSKCALADKDVSKVYGRNDVLEACSAYLDALDDKRVSMNRPRVDRLLSYSPAQSAALSTEDGVIALCSGDAGSNLNLFQIHRNVSNDLNAQARYIIIAQIRDGSIQDPLQVLGKHRHAIRKTSVVLSLENIPGSIFKMSSCFALREMDILKIESRPATTAISVPNMSDHLNKFTRKHWNFIYYVDFQPHVNEEINEAALRNLKEFCPWIINLGTYDSRLESTEATIGKSWNSLLDVALA
jgi:prephenate dehydratase